jgi:hypothetical protein
LKVSADARLTGGTTVRPISVYQVSFSDPQNRPAAVLTQTVRAAA